jgi:signal recognition particle receptor subunit beta
VPSSTTIAVLSPYGATHLNLVDIPGHPRLRDEVKKHVAETAGAIFVVDVVGIVRNAGEVAE